MECRGTILFTGVGKSGFIAQKISQTLVSAEDHPQPEAERSHCKP